MKRAAAAKTASSDAALSQMKALADPLRYRILEGLLAEPQSPKQMAERLGTHPTRLYHHFAVLEKAGLVRVASTRRKRGTTEKYFKATVDRIEIRAHPGGARAKAGRAIAEGVLASALAELQGAGDASPAYLKRYRIRATPDQAAEIRSRLEALSRYCEAAAASGGGEEISLTLALQETSTSKKQRSKR